MSYSLSTDKNSPLYCFLAGALLPTLAYTLFLRPRRSSSPPQTTRQQQGGDDDDDSSSEDEFEPVVDEGGADSPTLWGLSDAPYKMVLVVNTSLKMGKGKITAQCCHAAVGCYKKAKRHTPEGLRAWENTGCAKIAVKCPSEEEMTGEIMAKAAQKGIPYCLIEDAGRTQIAAGSRTVIGLGPAPVRLFDDITSHLKLM